MYVHEPCYDLAELARQNLHIHTTYSGCAKPEMVLPAIIETAENAGLVEIALTNHQNYKNPDEQCMEWLAQLRKEAAEIDTKLKIRFGFEFSCYGIDKTLEGDELRGMVDYRLYACNHYHVSNWEHPEDRSPRGYAKHTVEVVGSLLRSQKADCVAHPFIASYIFKDERREQVTAAITDNELGELLELATKVETAFELNAGHFVGDPAFSRRMWGLGKEIGTHFNVGTDAHRLVNIPTADFVERAKEIIR